jgi:ribosomal protein L33
METKSVSNKSNYSKSRIEELEKQIKDLLIKNEICDWTTNGDKHCKKNSVSIHRDNKYCNLHHKFISDYEVDDDTDDLCETFVNIKVIPRSYKQVEYFMKSIDNEDTIVDIMFPGGCIEEGDISNKEYITLLSDDSRFFYIHNRGEYKTKDMKLILRKFCKNPGKITVDNTKYCEECYKKTKNAPKFALIN